MTKECSDTSAASSTNDRKEFISAENRREFSWGKRDGTGARSGAVALPAGRSRVRFPMGSLRFFIDLILPTALWPSGSTQPRTETSTRVTSCEG